MKFEAYKYRLTALGIMTITVFIFIPFLLRVPANALRKKISLQEQQLNKKISVLGSTTAPYHINDIFVNGGFLPTKTYPKPSQDFGLTFPLSKDPNEWIKGLRFSLKNTYSSPIQYMTIKLFFPETTQSGLVMSYGFYLGQFPGHSDSAKKPISIATDSKFDFVLTDEDLQNIQVFLRKRNHYLSQLDKVQLVIDDIIYEDGKRWWEGAWYGVDPDKPAKYLKIKDPRH